MKTNDMPAVRGIPSAGIDHCPTVQPFHQLLPKYMRAVKIFRPAPFLPFRAVDVNFRVAFEFGWAGRESEVIVSYFERDAVEFAANAGNVNQILIRQCGKRNKLPTECKGSAGQKRATRDRAKHGLTESISSATGTMIWNRSLPIYDVREQL